MREENRKWLINIGLSAIILVASLPLLTNYCIEGIDVSFYIRQLEQGNIREVFLFLPGVLVKLGMPGEWAYRLMLFAVNVLTALMAYWAFTRMFEDEVVGLVGSMLYTWFPYRLGDLYSRGDLGEAVALCFLPLVLYGFYGIYTADNRSKEYGRLWMAPTLGLSCILCSYVLSFLTTVGFAVLLCLLMWRKTFRRETMLVLLKTVLATILCGGWLPAALLYLFRTGSFPATLERTGSIQRGGVYLANYLQLFFINGSSGRFDESGMMGMQPLGTGFAITVCVLLYLGLWFIGRYREKEAACGILFFGRKLLAAGGLFLLMSLNSFPWDVIGRKNRLFYVLVNCLQSPSRLIPLAALCFVFASCTALWQVRRWEKPETGRILAAVIAVIAFIGAQYLVGDILSTGEPRSLYGTPYRETLDSETAYLQANLDISPLDYGKYAGGNVGVPGVITVWEIGSVVIVAGSLAVRAWRKKRVEEV